MRTPDVYVWNARDLEPIANYTVEWGLKDLLAICNAEQSENLLSQHKKRGLWHEDDVDRVVLFLARYGTLNLRLELMRLANESPKSTAPSSLEEAVLYRVRTGSDEFRLRVCKAALSGGGRKRVTERVKQKDKKAKRKQKSPTTAPGE
jgi:hypothetical protein